MWPSARHDRIRIRYRYQQRSAAQGRADGALGLGPSRRSPFVSISIRARAKYAKKIFGGPSGCVADLAIIKPTHAMT